MADPSRSFDSKCYELAEYFLANESDLNTDKDRTTLAQIIQELVEDWIFWERDERGMQK